MRHLGVQRLVATCLNDACRQRQKALRALLAVAIVADMTGYADTFGRIDKQIENWRNSLE